jgi:hypothetical protein
MDTFFALPSSTTLTPLSSSVMIEDIVTPLRSVRPVRPIISSFCPGSVTGLCSTTNTFYPGIGISSIFQPTTAFYYDSGIGENLLAQHETNVDLRYKFLDKWLYEYFPDILRMLRVQNGSVKVVARDEAKNNDISKDSEQDLEKKSDFIGQEILSLSKNKKILSKLVEKNNLKWYDLEHNEHFVRKAQGKYVIHKLEEMLGIKQK